MRLGRALAVLTLLVVGCALFLPSALGGPASYVITDGTSMLPRFHAGGLVITRTQSSYQVGEVVAYRNKELHAVVMHRIVATDGNRYLFKGDNNDFEDRYRPTRADLVGKEWVYWAGAGRAMIALRNPVVFGSIIALATILSLGASPRRRRRRRHHGA